MSLGDAEKIQKIMNTLYELPETPSSFLRKIWQEEAGEEDFEEHYREMRSDK